jgi:hypothetical protein
LAAPLTHTARQRHTTLVAPLARTARKTQRSAGLHPHLAPMYMSRLLSLLQAMRPREHPHPPDPVPHAPLLAPYAPHPPRPRERVWAQVYVCVWISRTPTRWACRGSLPRPSDPVGIKRRDASGSVFEGHVMLKQQRVPDFKPHGQHTRSTHARTRRRHPTHMHRHAPCAYNTERRRGRSPPRGPPPRPMRASPPCSPPT